MRSGASLGAVLLAGGGLVASLALPWYGVEPAAVDTDAWTANWQAFLTLLDRQRSFEATVRGWSAPSSTGPLLALAAVTVLAGVVTAGNRLGRGLLAVGSVGALGVCVAGLLRVPEALELRVGVWISLACALMLLSGAHRASAY